MLHQRLDPQKTAPFELGSGDCACLLIHGLTGSPWDMRPLGEALASRGFFVKGIRLPGHGATPEALAQVSERDWDQACSEALHSLAGHRKVFVAGLSMGALLGILLAARYPERVHALSLVAPAMQFKQRSYLILQAAKRIPMFEHLMPWIQKTGTDIDDPKERAEAPVLRAVPSSRFRDLWDVQQKARAVLSQVKAPTLVAAAVNDHVVSLDGAKELVAMLTAAPSVRFVTIEQGFHIIPRDKGHLVLEREVGEFFERLRG